jgi:hypothetical protein
MVRLKTFNRKRRVCPENPKPLIEKAVSFRRKLKSFNFKSFGLKIKAEELEN